MHVKALLNIKLTYFKESGKYYDSADFFRDFEDCHLPLRAPEVSAPMAAVCEEVRRMSAQGVLPGLASGQWEEGFILVDCAQGYPCLLKMTGQSEFQQQ